MIIPKSGGNPNVYGSLWNHALGKMGCLGCGLGTTTDITSYFPYALAAVAAWYFMKKR